MSDVFKKLSALKSEHGFVLVRATRHQIWKSREGTIWVCASTPSDYRVAGNQLTSLKRAIREGNQSEIIAISQFERDEADAILEGQKKQEANRAGAAGTRKKSQGVGIFYIETGRTLEEMTPEAREAHLKASQDAARRQQEREKLEREQRRSERILLKDFLGFMDAQIDAAEAEDIALFETTFAYEDRAVRAMRRKLLGKKLTLITMKSDETRGIGREWAIQAMEGALVRLSHIAEVIRNEALKHKDGDPWDYVMPCAVAKTFTPETWEAECGLDRDVASARVFREEVTAWKKHRIENLDRIREYLRKHALDFATAPSPEYVHKKLTEDIEAKTLYTESYEYPGTVTNFVTDAVVDWRIGWEKKQSAKVCEQRIALDVMYEPRGPLDGVIFAARKMREDVAAMQATLRDFEKLIRKI